MKTIVLNGLTWDAENLVLNGETHFTYREALNIAKAFGKRLPSKKELAKLSRLPHKWDNDKQGMWFAENQKDLMGDKSLFLPAVGFRVYCDTTMSGVGMSGYYWSDTPDGSDYAYYLVFDNFDAFMNSSVRRYGASVRFVHIQTKKKKE